MEREKHMQNALYMSKQNVKMGSNFGGTQSTFWLLAIATNNLYQIQYRMHVLVTRVKACLSEIVGGFSDILLRRQLKHEVKYETEKKVAAVSCY